MVSGFDSGARNKALVNMIKAYNRRVADVTTETAIMIDIPHTLLNIIHIA
jgi:hypothetical protein